MNIVIAIGNYRKIIWRRNTLMKKAVIFTLMAAAGLMCFTACGQKFTDVDLKVKQITVTSSSVNKSGRLLTESAADKSPNSPLGSNKSPQLTWNTVDGAGCYAVCMFDEDANWLHWLAAGI